MKKIKTRYPHIFEAGKDSRSPGPYCRFCHYSVAYANAAYCPKRRKRWHRPSDKERLDFWGKNPSKAGFANNVGSAGGGEWGWFPGESWRPAKSIRAAIDAAIRESRRGKRG
jgi:hypothetical protein